MEHETPKTNDRQKSSEERSRRRRGPRRPRFEMRISTKYAPSKPSEGKPLTCITETRLKPEQMIELYRYLKLTRLVEERLVNLYRQTKVVGGVFRSLGQEATAVGSAYALRPGDFVTPLIRDLGAVLVKGIRPRDVFAQYMAKAWGPSGGRDLNIHFGDMEKGFIGPISHLGDMIPVMTGVLLAARMQKKPSVAIAYIGDGGMSTGAFHEGLNFAAVQRLPLIIIAEHNHPVDRYERYLIECGVADKGKLAEIETDVQSEIDEDVAWAESSPMPEAEQAAYRVFDNNIVKPALRPEVLKG